MTTITFALSRALARTWDKGDAIVVTDLDHDANITPWVMAAEDRGVEVRRARIRADDMSIDVDHLVSLLDDRVRLVAVTRASNAFGTIVDVDQIARAAHDRGALVYVDGVHFTPHGLPDVAALGADFYVCSAYKFFGPHIGALWGRRAVLDAIEPYRVRPAPATTPGKFETGTQSFEGLAGVGAAIDYLASLGGDSGARAGRLAVAYATIGRHERSLSRAFLDGIGDMGHVRLYGVADPDGPRVPTFAVSVEGLSAGEVAARLNARGMFVWAGHYYAVAPMQRLGLLESGGLVRIGFVHTTTAAEVERLLDALQGMGA